MTVIKTRAVSRASMPGSSIYAQATLRASERIQRAITESSRRNTGGRFKHPSFLHRSPPRRRLRQDASDLGAEREIAVSL